MLPILAITTVRSWSFFLWAEVSGGEAADYTFCTCTLITLAAAVAVVWRASEFRQRTGQKRGRFGKIFLGM